MPPKNIRQMDEYRRYQDITEPISEMELSNCVTSDEVEALKKVTRARRKLATQEKGIIQHMYNQIEEKVRGGEEVKMMLKSWPSGVSRPPSGGGRSVIPSLTITPGSYMPTPQASRTTSRSKVPNKASHTVIVAETSQLPPIIGLQSNLKGVHQDQCGNNNKILDNQQAHSGNLKSNNTGYCGSSTKAKSCMTSISFPPQNTKGKEKQNKEVVVNSVQTVIIPKRPDTAATISALRASVTCSGEGNNIPANCETPVLSVNIPPKMRNFHELAEMRKVMIAKGKSREACELTLETLLEDKRNGSEKFGSYTTPRPPTTCGLNSAHSGKFHSFASLNDNRTPIGTGRQTGSSTCGTGRVGSLYPRTPSVLSGVASEHHPEIITWSDLLRGSNVISTRSSDGVKLDISRHVLSTSATFSDKISCTSAGYCTRTPALEMWSEPLAVRVSLITGPEPVAPISSKVVARTYKKGEDISLSHFFDANDFDMCSDYGEWMGPPHPPVPVQTPSSSQESDWEKSVRRDILRRENKPPKNSHEVIEDPIPKDERRIGRSLYYRSIKALKDIPTLSDSPSRIERDLSVVKEQYLKNHQYQLERKKNLWRENERKRKEDLDAKGEPYTPKVYSEDLEYEEMVPLMEPCYILDFNQRTRSYTIQWISNLVETKVVRPLCLQFPCESDEAFRKRILAAERKRDEAEAVERLREYSKNSIGKDIPPISESDLQRIVLHVSAFYPKQYIQLMENCINEIAEDVYQNPLKMSVIRHHLKSMNNRRKLEELRLPPKMQYALEMDVKDIEKYGAYPDVTKMRTTVEVIPGVDNRRTEMSRMKKFLADELFVAHESLYHTARFASNSWVKYEGKLLIITDPDELKIPLSVHDFHTRQCIQNEEVIKDLEEVWLGNIIASILNELASIFDFMVEDPAVFTSSRMCRFLKRINLCLSDQLQGLVYDSLDALTKFFKSLRPDAATIEAIKSEGTGHDARQSPMFLLRVGCFGNKQIIPPSMRADDAAEPLDEPQSLGMNDISTSSLVQGIVPLLSIRIDIVEYLDSENPRHSAVEKLMGVGEEKRVSLKTDKDILENEENAEKPTEGTQKRIRQSIEFVPGLWHVEESIRSMYNTTLESTDSMLALGPQLFPLLQIKDTFLTEHAKSYRSTDQRVIICEEEMNAMLIENLGGPVCLLRLYQDFQYILDIDIDEFIDKFQNFDGPGKPPKLKDYDHICMRITEHIEYIQKRSLSEIVFPLLRVDCRKLKELLTSKAKAIIVALLRHLIDDTNSRIDASDKEFAFVNDRVQIEPKDPFELKELKDFVDDVPKKIKGLSDEFNDITESVHLLGKYGFMPDQEAFEKYWNSYSWPRKIELTMDDVPFRLQIYRAQFIGELREKIVKVQEDIATVTRQCALLSFEDDERKIDQVLPKVIDLESKINNLREGTNLCNEYEKLFQQPVTKWTTLCDVDKQFATYNSLWKMASESRELEAWMDVSIEKIDSQDVQLRHGNWMKEATKLGKLLLKEAPYAVVKSVKDRLDAFIPILPLAQAVVKPSVLNRRRHVAKIAELGGENPKTFDLANKTLHELVKMNLLDHIVTIVELSKNADQEAKLEAQLSAMKDAWQKISFNLLPYFDTFLLQSTDHIRDMLDEHIMKTQTMLASPYSIAIMTELKPWEEKLLLISATLDAWLTCQFGFHYLDHIFTHSKDIAKAMPLEARLFEGIRMSWVSLMESVSKTSHVSVRCSDERLLPIFEDNNVKLDRILKELVKYLDTKRVAFPRFYFLSNEDLIEILSQSTDPTLVQPHLRKCFEGIHRLIFSGSDEIERKAKNAPKVDPSVQTTPINKPPPDPSLTIIEGMKSDMEENVMFLAPVDPVKDYECVVEAWLKAVEKKMFQAVNDQLVKGMEDYFEAKSRSEWVLKWPGQVVITVSQIIWTLEVEAEIQSHRLHIYDAKVKSQLNEMALLVREDLSALNLQTLQSLIVLDIHARDITTMLYDKSISSLDDFNWISQLRYYLEKTPTKASERDPDGLQRISVRQTIADLPYGNEYLGNTGRLVITPLTDRCYRALTAAYHLNYGGAPEGPAGTGKTETTKDLAKSVARMCVVFNCSDTIKSHEFEKLLRGLAATGGWGCFDEFNRIETQVLSVIAQQVLSIQNAVAEKKNAFLFEGKLSDLKVGCSVFVTMNPGYAGRSELPDNLKALFRPVAMMVPDYALIAENSLYACGFLQATSLSKKIVATYKLASEQLSTQSHYDFGMRAVKAVLTSAQGLRKKMENDSELSIVMRSVIDVNLPKFLSNDAFLFGGIVRDLFGDIKLDEPDYKDLHDGLNHHASSNNLQMTTFFTNKILQIYEMLKVRHGVMVVGYSLCGKTKALQTLCGGLSWARNNRGTFNTCHIHTLNPKSLTMNQLYGYNDASGTEWHNGVLSSIFRTASQETDNEVLNWLVLDGPVDAIWIENMNTVLDDNKKLCLANGDFIRMSCGMTMIFVVQDLLAASPATVSRCGMIYMEPKELGWNPLVVSWINQMEKINPRVFKYSKESTSEKDNENKGDDPNVDEVKSVSTIIMGTFSTLFSVILTPLFEFLRKETFALPMSEQMLCSQFLLLLRVVCTELFGFVDDSNLEEVLLRASELDVKHYAESVFVYCIVWGIGSILKEDSGRKKFILWLYSAIDHEAKKGYVYKPVVALPDLTGPINTLFGFKLILPPSFVGNVTWKDWITTVDEVSLEKELEIPYHEISVPTADSITYDYFTNALLKANQVMLLVGSTGTGKTQIIKNVMRLFDPVKFTKCVVQFSAQTTAASLQYNIESPLERRKGHRYGPPMGKKMIVFIDDLGMPECDKYGAQPPIELLRQFVQIGGWYSTKKTEFGFKEIDDVLIVAASQPPNAARPAVTNRVIRHFFASYLAPQSTSSLKKIFCRLMEQIIYQPSVNVGLRSIRDPLVNFTVDLFQSVSERMLPTPEKSHYTFNLRDLCRVFQGVSGLNPQSCREESDLIHLVVHECIREFGDRLTCKADSKKFEAILSEKLNKHLKRNLDSLLIDEKVNDVLYSNIFTSDIGDRAYVHVSKPEQMAFGQKIIEDTIAHHNSISSSNSRINLIVFDFVIRHVSKVCRIIQQPNGSALLVGLGGSGRRSVARLAALMLKYTVCTCTQSRNYNKDSWREDISFALKNAGERGLPTMLLLVDTDISDESFLEDVCNILNTGAVPGLFSGDVFDPIAYNLRPILRKSNIEFTMEAAMDCFVSRVKTNLHFTLCFNPVGATLRNRLRRFPTLVNCTSIDWMMPWPENDLLKVALHRIQTDDLIPKDKAPEIAKILVMMFEDSEKEENHGIVTRSQPITMHITPTIFLDLTSTFLHLAHKIQDETLKLCTRYEQGLRMMYKTETSVSTMQATLKINQPVLEEKAAEMKVIIVEIDGATAEADKERAEVRVEEEQANKIMEGAKEVKEDCEANLAVAMPAMDAATKAVSEIDKKQIVELKSMANPPERIKKIIEAVCIVLDVKPDEKRCPITGKKTYDYWTPTKTKVMADAEEFRSMLMNYDKENMNPEIFEKKIQPYIKDKNFKPQAVKDVSQALVGVTQWVIAMETYYRVVKVVRPKQLKLKEAEQEFNDAMAILNDKKEKLRQIDERLAGLRMRLDDCTKQREVLEEEQRETELKLHRAVRLMDGLEDEKVRYTNQVKELTERLNTVVGDSLLSAGFVACLGPFTHMVRMKLLDGWKSQAKTFGVPISDNYDFALMHTTPLQHLNWKTKGLPVDSFSIDSAALVHTTIRFPYIVDPQGQAGVWLKATERPPSKKENTDPSVTGSPGTTGNLGVNSSAALSRQKIVVKGKKGESSAPKEVDLSADRDNRQLIVVRQTDKTFQQQIINCIKHGHTVIVEDCNEEIDPFLLTVLNKDVVLFEGSNIITLGEITIPYHDSFKLFMLSKNARPVFAPELSTKVCIVGFFITPDGLNDQTVQRIIQFEEKEQIEKRNRIVEQQSFSKGQLLEIEDTILEMVSADDDLLKNDVVCDTLDQSKRTAQSISQRLSDGEAFQRTFDKIRSKFLDAATRISSLFFTIESMNNINPMYQFSLEFFMQCLGKALIAKEPGESDEEGGGGDSSKENGSEDVDPNHQFLNNFNTGEPISREERAIQIRENFNLELYNKVSHGLFAKDHIVYSFLFSAKANYENPEEVYFFATGGVDVPPEKTHPSKPEGISESSWSAVVRASEQLTCSDKLSRLTEIIANEDPEEHFIRFASMTLEKEIDDVPLGYVEENGKPVTLGGKWDAEFTPLEKLIVIRCLRPDLITDSVRDYVVNSQGKKFISPPIVDVREVLAEQKGMQHVPLFFILSSGADPMVVMQSLAEQYTMVDHFITISLGSGMGPRAEEAIEKAMKVGEWVMLQNCHLYYDWMPKLDRIIEDYTASFSINKNAISPMFKLWLTAMPSDAIPATLLQKSVKMVMEPPSGMKANLANSYSRPPVSDEDFFEGSANPAVWKKLCFALCFLHAVLQERRSYGSIGWNIPYSFNDADLRISLSQIKLFVDKGTELRNNEGSVLSKRISTIKRMNEASDVWLENTDLAAKYISFESMQYLIGECNYGGRVTDTHDRRLLNNLVESFINPLVLESTTQLDPESDNYPMPPASDGNAAFYSKFISGLPAAPAPSLMGLNSNCSLVRNEIESSALLLAVSATLPRMVSSSDSGNKNKGSVEEGDNDETTVSADQQRLERICNNVLSRIRKPYDIVAIEEIRPIIGDNSEFSNVVLIQELHRFNRLINKIRSTLYALTLALMGQVVLTAELDSVANDILLSHPPEAWASSSYPTLKPFGGYITDLEARIEVLDKWIEHGPEPVCWLGGLFFPHSFITGVLQNYCRKKAGTGLTIDRLVWSSRVLDQNYPTTKRAEEGWYFGGLYLEACGWDNSTQQLREAKPGVMMEDLPVIHLYPSIIPEEKEEVIGESYTLDKHDDLLVGKNLPLDVKSDDKTEGSDDTINDMENEKIDMKPTLSCHNFAILTRSSVLSDAINPNVANKVGDLARRESLYVKESHANTLSEKSLAKHVKISGIAPVTVDPKFNSEVDNDQDMYTYECPIYRTNARRGVLATTGHSTNFIMSVKLPIPSFTLESHWVKRGAALLTSTNF